MSPIQEGLVLGADPSAFILDVSLLLAPMPKACWLPHRSSPSSTSMAAQPPWLLLCDSLFRLFPWLTTLPPGWFLLSSLCSQPITMGNPDPGTLGPLLARKFGQADSIQVGSKMQKDVYVALLSTKVASSELQWIVQNRSSFYFPTDTTIVCSLHGFCSVFIS